jgi:hypothetical protein
MRRFLAVGIVGLGLGWLIGLSQSPVIAGVVTALIAAAGALVGTFGSLKEPAAGRVQDVARLVDPAPLAALVLGLAVAAPFGLYARSSGMFSHSWKDPMQATKQTIERWEALGLKHDFVVARLFDREYPEPGRPVETKRPEAPSIPSGLVSGAGSPDECGTMRMAAADKALLELRASKRPAVRNLASALADVSNPARVGQLLLEVVCPTTP